MKQGKFITCASLKNQTHSNPWQPGAVYNSYEREIKCGDGILTVKKSFSVEKRKVASAVLRSTALGIYVPFLNGIEVCPLIDGERIPEYMRPGWTDYKHRVFENEYDITEYIKNKNVFVAEVSNGWWSGRISFGFYGFKKTAFCGEIEIKYKDGTSEVISTNETWEATVCGPVLSADIWDGEYLDARFPHASVKPNVYTWENAEIFDGFEGKIVPFEGCRITDREGYLPKSAVVYKGVKKNGTEYGEIKVENKYPIGFDFSKVPVKKGHCVIFDFGKNLVGNPDIFVKAKKGTRIDVFFAEMLNDTGDVKRGNDGPKGSLYLSNYRSAFSGLTYICRGGNDVEEIAPCHSYYGFRYMEIRADKDLELCSPIMYERGAEMNFTGSFECDNPEVNRLFENTVSGMKGNYFAAPTDCPQRDERLGWTGDTQIFAPTASYLADIRPFMHKWLGDARLSQIDEDGAYCDVVPRVFKGSHNGNAAWGDAGIIVPYVLYKMFGDSRVVYENYDAMEEYMSYIDRRFGLNGPDTASYGDWLNYDVTDKHYISVCYYAYDAMIMAEFSDLVGQEDKAEYYSLLRKKIISHWKEKYVSGDKLIVDTQTGYLLALGFGLADEKLEKTFIKRLEEKITENDYTLSCGFVGTGVLNPTLSKIGLHKLAYDLLLQTKDPSWLYPVRLGATTMWERWNSYTSEKGFGDVCMNSFNHYAYGAVCEWLFSDVCGIKPSEKGFFHGFIVKPTPDFRMDTEVPAGQKRINYAKASYEFSDELYCDVSWQRINGKIEYNIDIRSDYENTVSIISNGKLNINGLDFDYNELDGKYENGRTEFKLVTGSYRIITEDFI